MESHSRRFRLQWVLVTRHWSLLFPLLLSAVLAWAAAVPATVTGTATGEDSFREPRESMVRDQIVARGVRDERVLQVLREVPRHRFVPPGLQDQAYTDKPLPIGADQTVSQPYIVALMTELLHPQPGDVVLEVGTGSGYQAAVLSRLVAQVYSIEIVPSLAQAAARRLADLGFPNIAVKIGDGYLGWPEHAPFDGIVVTAAPSEIPPVLVTQLKRGGRMVVPIGKGPNSQKLVLLEKSKSSEEVTQREVIPVRFVPMVRRPNQGGTRN